MFLILINILYLHELKFWNFFVQWNLSCTRFFITLRLSSFRRKRIKSVCLIIKLVRYGNNRTDCRTCFSNTKNYLTVSSMYYECISFQYSENYQSKLNRTWLKWKIRDPKCKLYSVTCVFVLDSFHGIILSWRFSKFHGQFIIISNSSHCVLDKLYENIKPRGAVKIIDTKLWF